MKWQVSGKIYISNQLRLEQQIRSHQSAEHPQASAEPSCNAFMRPLYNQLQRPVIIFEKGPGIDVYAKPKMKSHSSASCKHESVLYYGTEEGNYSQRSDALVGSGG